jgi:hypothetical protein
MEMKIARLEDENIYDPEARDYFLEDIDNYEIVPMKPKLKPSKAHTVPFVTG